MDELSLKFCEKCIDDHEVRLRAIEKNNKLELRVEILEGFMKGEIAISGQKKEHKVDTFTIISLILSIISIVPIVVKIYID